MTYGDWIQTLMMVATFLAVLAALFGPAIARWWNATKLAVCTNDGMPDMVRCPIPRPSYGGQQLVEAMVVLATVQNAGKTPARNLEAYLSSLERKNAANKWLPADKFLADQLIWSGTNQTVCQRIAPGATRQVQLLLVLKPEETLAGYEGRPTSEGGAGAVQMELRVASPTHGKFHLRPVGTYRLTVVVSGDNAKPVRHEVEVELREPWADDYETCRRTCVIVKPSQSTA